MVYSEWKLNFTEAQFKLSIDKLIKLWSLVWFSWTGKFAVGIPFSPWHRVLPANLTFKARLARQNKISRISRTEYPWHGDIQNRISMTWGYPEQNIHDLVISRTEYPWHGDIHNRISMTREYPGQNTPDIGISRTEYPWHEDIQDRIFKTEYPWHGDIQDWRISRTWGYPGQEDIQDNVNNYVSFLVFKRSTMPLMLIYLNIDIDKFDKYVFKYLREKIRHVK